MTKKRSNLIAKRLHLTKSKKILRRVCGQNHFNARESRKIVKNKRQDKPLNKNFYQTVKQHI